MPDRAAPPGAGPKCPQCESTKMAPTKGNARGMTHDCLVCYTDFTPGAEAGPTDRLHDIGMKGTAQATVADATWLFEQVSRLREEVAYLRAAAPAGTAFGGQICPTHGKAVLVCHVDDGEACGDYLRSAPAQRQGDPTGGGHDALDWAKTFVATVRKNPAIATDEGTMLAWFADAIMRGYDAARAKYGPALQPGGTAAPAEPTPEQGD